MDSMSNAEWQIFLRGFLFDIMVGVWAGRRSASFWAGVLWFLVALVGGGLMAVCFLVFLPDGKRQRLRQKKTEVLGRLLASAQQARGSRRLSGSPASVETVGNLPTVN